MASTSLDGLYVSVRDALTVALYDYFTAGGALSGRVVGVEPFDLVAIMAHFDYTDAEIMKAYHLGYRVVVDGQPMSEKHHLMLARSFDDEIVRRFTRPELLPQGQARGGGPLPRWRRTATIMPPLPYASNRV